MDKAARKALEVSPAEFEKAWKYRRIIIELDSGVHISLLKNERSRRDMQRTPFFVLVRDIPAMHRRLRELGEKKLKHKMLERMVNEGYVQTW